MQVNLVASELERIHEEAGGLTPEAVVAAAEMPESPLHSCFTWDDAEAATQHRMSEARKLISAVVITYVDADKETIPVQAFLSVMQDDGSRQYKSAMAVMGDPGLRETVLEQARRELVSWRRRYDGLGELAAIYEAIDQQAA